MPLIGSQVLPSSNPLGIGVRIPQFRRSVKKATTAEFGASLPAAKSGIQMMPEEKHWELVFRLLKRFETNASFESAYGNSEKAQFLRRFPSLKYQLSVQKAEMLRMTAEEFSRDAEELKVEAERNIKERRLKEYKIHKDDELDELLSERERLPILYRERLRERLGKLDFEKFATHIQEDFTSKATYKVVSNEFAVFGFSEVFYDDPAQEVYGYSITEVDAGLGCGGEWLTPCLAAEVDAVFTSDMQGQFDQGYDYQCLGTAEVDFYISGADPAETFCIVGEHEIYDDETCQGPPLFYEFYGVGGRFANVSEDCVTTPVQPQVNGVVFELIATDDLPIDNNPNIGGGQRIFPDDRVPNDTTDRRRIRVRAGLSEARAGETIHFRSFDLDDPSSDTIIDPNGTTGDDNTGTPLAGQLHTTSATTNSNGEASVEFSVTMQPGDNFAIAASTDHSVLAGVNVSGTDLVDGNGATVDIGCDGTVPICRSEMLTVWRRLHIEVDSMAASNSNFVLGNFGESARVGGNPVEVQVNVASPLEVNRFENGRLASGGTNFIVVENSANSVTIRSPLGQTVRVNQSELFQLYDDDDFDDDGGLLNGDTGEDIPEPDTSLLTANSDDPNTNFLASAYVRPVYDIVDTRDNLIFAANVASDAANDIRALFAAWDSSGTNTSNEFWSVYLLGSYQHTITEDRDPSTESLTLGIVDEITSVTGEGSGALIFVEGHRPTEFPGYNPSPTHLSSMAVTVAHEIGHLFSCLHGDGGLMGTNPQTGEPVSNQLSPTMIRKIRTIMHP